MADLLTRSEDAVAVLRRFVAEAKASVAAVVTPDRVDAEQRRLHAFAWAATTVEALAQLHGWALRAKAADRFGEGEALVIGIAFAEYAAQLLGGLPMSQNELARPWD